MVTAPTCVLIEPDGKTFSAFGNDAETKYSQLAGNPAICQKWYFFRRFKMKLYNKTIKREMEIEDETGKKVKATTVFAVAICYLKNDFLSIINDRISGVINPAEIVWVLTAGIPAEKLTIALEPESASIYCRNLQLERSGGEHTLSTLKSGTKFLVVDAGGNETLLEYKRTHMEDYLYLISDFEVKKRAVNLLQSNITVTLRISVTLSELVQKIKGKTLEDLLKESQHSSEVSLSRDKLKFEIGFFVTFFKPQIDSIIDHVSGIVEQQNVSEIEAIVLYLDVGEAQVKQVYTPSTSWQTYMPFPVYCTLDQNPMYTTDDGCHYAGTLTVPFEGSGLDREVDVRMIYGGTEIEVEATEVATGKVHRIK
ncbi:HS12A-like protein, partial [Mya arenaria]